MWSLYLSNKQLSTNLQTPKILLIFCCNSTKCRQTCTCGTGPPSELVNNNGGGGNRGIGGGRKAGDNYKSVADGHRQQSTLSGNGNDGGNGNSNSNEDINDDGDGRNRGIIGGGKAGGNNGN